MTSNVQGRDTAASTNQSIEDPQGPGKRFSRIFGALFIAGFLVYGIGFGLVSSVTTAPDFMATLSAHSTTLLRRRLPHAPQHRHRHREGRAVLPDR